jgi:hypothetical protein
MPSIFMTIVTFTFILTFVLGLYGAAVGSVDLVNAETQITGAWPTISTAKCSFSSEGPAGSCNLLDTVTLGGIWIIASIGSILFRIGAVFFLVFQIFSILNSFSGFPFLGWFFGLCLFIMAIGSYMLLRSGHLPT